LAASVPGADLVGPLASLLLIPAGLAGYLMGSIPSGVLLARVFGWPNPRAHGSGHTGALNASRGGGIAALLLVMVADLAKGLAAVWLAASIAPGPWAIPVGGVAAVAGHNWPVWLGFQGGMGLSTAAGALASWALPALLIVAALLVVFRLITGHTPRATIAACLCAPVVFWLLPTSPPVFWLGTVASLLIAIRHLHDWNRVYP
jgi:acyl phosphate:glycerol-3-phosphate acyltransferase